MGLADVCIRLAVALLLGAVIGLERQWHNHYAGLRTNTLITIGAAALVIFARLLPGVDGTGVSHIAAQIITGVGFLCAGVIMHEGVNVKGLNTAATLWCSVGVGMFAGAGLFWPAIIQAAFIVIANLCLRPIVYYINNRTPVSDELDAHYTLSVTCHTPDVKRIRKAFSHRIGPERAHLKSVENSFQADTAQVNAEFLFNGRSDSRIEAIADAISDEAGVTGIKWYLH